jgi:predicted GNAT family acetyltransferase
MSSLFAQYIREREGKEIVETENGFATFFYTGEYCYIEDIYVKPELRKSGLASELANQISEIAKNKGVKKLLGSVSPKATGADASMRVLLAYGFKLLSSDKDLIYFEKEII